jgi:hypothetical protein
MTFVVPSPSGGHAIAVVAVLAAFVWLIFVSSGRHRWMRRAAIIAYLLALGLVVAEVALWLLG